jgi:hypothetical protein
MLKIIEQFFKSFGELFPDLKVRRYILLLIFISLPLLIWFIDSQTNLVFFWYLERKVEILKNLNGLNKELVMSHEQQFNKAYLQILNELDSHSYFSITERICSILKSGEKLIEYEGFWKFISGSFIGYLCTVVLIIQLLLGDKSVRNTILGAVAFGSIFGGIGILIPNLFTPWVNYIFYPISQALFLVYFSQNATTNTTGQ